ncbi:hypothetical protein [Altererythrobacter sp. MF3-039]|uniref:hypothetical protein n=1 Tax=Altererythrobacter sp. MF3-039 TaxID=3252901 RepID=UPI00390CD440
MATIRSIDILDVARALGERPFAATPESVSHWLSDYSRRKGGGFNYNTAITTLYDAFRGLHTAQSARDFCLSNGNPKGRSQNADAISAAMPYALEHPSVCHRIGLTAVAIGRYDGRNVYAKIKAPLVRVEDGRAFLVMPGFRMGYRPRNIEIDFACSVALQTLAQGDLSAANFEYLYAGPGPDILTARGQKPIRSFQAIDGGTRERFDQQQIDRLLDIFVKGVALADQVGADAREPKLNGYRIIDPRQSSMF